MMQSCLQSLMHLWAFNIFSFAWEKGAASKTCERNSDLSASEEFINNSFCSQLHILTHDFSLGGERKIDPNRFMD